MKKSYGLGLGLNSMEGREAKHIAISKYCLNYIYIYIYCSSVLVTLP